MLKERRTMLQFYYFLLFSNVSDGYAKVQTGKFRFDLWPSAFSRVLK